MSDAPLLDEQLCFPLYATSRVLTRCYTRLLGPHGLTYTQYVVLMVLWEEPETSVGHLGSRLALDSGTLTPLLRKLESGGLVTRARDVADERRVLVTLTSQGRALQGALKAVPGQMREATGLTDGEIAGLKSSLERVMGSLHEWLADDPD